MANGLYAKGKDEEDKDGQAPSSGLKACGIPSGTGCTEVNGDGAKIFPLSPLTGPLMYHSDTPKPSLPIRGGLGGPTPVIPVPE